MARSTPLGVIACLLLAVMLPPRAASAQTAPASGGPVQAAAALDDLVVANRILADRGIIDAYGHVSLRHPNNPSRYLLARSLSPGLVTADDIMEFDLDSNPVDRRGRLIYSERFIHGEIYKLRPDVNAVVHSHSEGVIPFGITQVPLRPVFHSAAFLHAGVPVFEIRNAGSGGNMLVMTPAFGKALAQTLADKPVVLMRGHGDAVVGSDVRRAVARAIFTDQNARLQILALQLGGPINYISEEEGIFRDRNPSGSGDQDRGWELWKAKAMGK
jgi:HCOMODA/2-hydroxy-3-carboxy-muconic semialdehyde decarboxylase